MQSGRVWGFPSGAVAVLEDGDRYPVQICLLGSFRLLRFGQPVDVRSGGKTATLLEILGLATRHGVARELLLSSLWPDSEAALAGNALNNLVYSLRGVLADALDGASPVVHTAGYYRLNTDAGITVDVTRFKHLVARSERLATTGDLAAAAEIAEQAVHLYRGDLSLCAGFGARNLFERGQLRATCLALLMRLADYAFARSDFAACQAYSRQLLDFDPCREDAHRLVMRCHVRLGERAQALRHFQTVRAILHAEFDADPEPATRALYDQIRLDPGNV
jgi:DNA-binding SARP family transcriptional activator